MEAAAIRETFEETGYPNELLPLRQRTRAPLPGSNTHDAVLFTDNISEPFMITVRDLGEGTKIIWWYLTRAKPGAEKMENTQTATEQFDSHWVDAKEAVEQTTYKLDREVVATALAVLTENLLLRPTLLID